MQQIGLVRRFLALSFLLVPLALPAQRRGTAARPRAAATGDSIRRAIADSVRRAITDSIARAGAAAATPADSAARAGGPMPRAASAGPVRDSAAAAATVAYARRAQADFEKQRKENLPFGTGGATAGCDVTFGTICYWNNNDDVPPKPERPEQRAARSAFLRTLNEAAAAVPGDDWIAGQRVKYAMEEKDKALATRAAAECRGTAWWCAALTGLARHDASDHTGATEAFDRALSLMPEAQRCRWLDLAPWLGTADSTAVTALPCAQRIAEANRILWLGKPFWHQAGNDLRSELLARHTYNAIERNSASVYGGTVAEIAAVQLRYGWPTAWSTQNTIVNAQGGMVSNITGHEPTPSHDFMPSTAAMRNPNAATAADWPFNARKAHMRYAPRYAPGGFQSTGYQFARFRRGDSTLLVGAWVMEGKARWERGTTRAALVVQKGPGEEIARTIVEKRPLRGGIALALAPRRDTVLASLELLSDARKFAGRARTGVATLAADVQLSDPLLLAARAAEGDAPGSAGVASLEAVLPRALGTTELTEGQAFGLYWEWYGAPGAQVAISITPLDKESALGRVASIFRLGSGPAGSASLRFPDPAQPGGGPGRRLVLVWPQSRPGRYLLSLDVSGPDGTKHARSLTIRVPSPDEELP
jgi:hypothetical protein